MTKEVLVFAGTSEGRELAGILARNNIAVTVCVATTYGREVMGLEETPGLTIRTGRMSQEEMEKLIGQKDWRAVIDATHPFAQEVTRNLSVACEKTGRRVWRLIREKEEISCGATCMGQGSRMILVRSAQEAIRYLNSVPGMILLTTGSKELPEYLSGIADISRVYVRILPIGEEIERCKSLGLKGKQIIAMQGPFSEPLNTAILQEIGADILVTKETAQAGGFPEKLAAAKKAGADLVVIQRPEEEGYSLEGILAKLQVKPAVSQELPVDIEMRPNKEPLVTLAGIGMGNRWNMTQEVCEACVQADVVIGAKRMLETVEYLGKPMVNLYKSQEIADFILKNPRYRKVVVLLSGDVGFYSGARRLLETFKDAGMVYEDVTEGVLGSVQTEEYLGISEEGKMRYRIRQLCGITSVSYLAGKLQIPWEDIALMSVHGRQQNVVGVLDVYGKAFVLTDGAKGVSKLGEELLAYGFEDADMYVGSRLSYPDEEIISGKPKDFLGYGGKDLASVIVISDHAKAIGYGRPDAGFIRGNIPMTKAEVRSISLSKLSLRQDSIVYDIGAGSGSVSVECGKLAIWGKVYAIEKNKEALGLIDANKHRFRAQNVELIEGEAPKALRFLPPPTHAFIGGSGGKLKEILWTMWEKSPKVRIVLNIISLDTLGEAMEVLQEGGFAEQEILQVSIAKSKELGNHHLMMAQNPIYIVTLQRA
ncbi:precorrin-6A reductase [Lachnospiraceae bacterium 29-84]